MNSTDNKKHIYGIIGIAEEHLAADNKCAKLQNEISYISGMQLHRDFYSVTGYTVKEYIRKRRLSNALAQIKVSEQPLAEIAYSCVYSSQQALCREIKTTFGITALEYRQTMNISTFRCFIGDKNGDSLSDTEMLEYALETMDRTKSQDTGYIEFEAGYIAYQKWLDACDTKNNILEINTENSLFPFYLHINSMYAQECTIPYYENLASRYPATENIVKKISVDLIRL